LNTISMFITFHGKLEDAIKAFYENMAEKESDIASRDIFRELAKENIKHKDMVLRTYREIITDAFEGGFPITELDEKDYELKIDYKEDMNLSDILKKAIDLEEISCRFCEDASKSINGLIVEVSQAFAWIKKRKQKRSQKLKNLLIK